MMSSCTWPYHSCIIGTCHPLADMFVQHPWLPSRYWISASRPKPGNKSKSHISDISSKAVTQTAPSHQWALFQFAENGRKVHIWHLTTGLERLASSRRFQLDSTFLGSRIDDKTKKVNWSQSLLRNHAKIAMACSHCPSCWKALELWI